MSETYEAIIVRGERSRVQAAFEQLRSPLTWRLVRLTDSDFGIYRVAGRSENVEFDTVLEAARMITSRLSTALALAYDNRREIRTAALVGTDGIKKFELEDELWVPLDEDGLADLAARTLRSDELEPDGEYDCVRSAIDLGLDAFKASSDLTGGVLKDAFCYERFGWEAERLPETSES